MLISKYIKKWFHTWTSGIFSDDVYIKIFRKAKKVLKEDGWIKGSYYGPGGCCILGARAKAARLVMDEYVPFASFKCAEIMQKAVNNSVLVPSTAGSLTTSIHFNDSIARDIWDVLNIFDESIKIRIHQIYS